MTSFKKRPLGKGRRTAAAAAGVAAIGMAALVPLAQAAPATVVLPEPADPTLIFSENFGNNVGVDVIGLTSYAGANGVTYTADAFWLNAAACNGLVLQDGATWIGTPGAACDPSGVESARDKLMTVADAMGGPTNHVVAAYTEGSGANNLVLVQSENSGIEVEANKFYVSSIDIGEMNCDVSTATASSINFGLELASGEKMFGGQAASACNNGSDLGSRVKGGKFYSDGLLADETGGGNDFAYDNLGFYEATPSLAKWFADSDGNELTEFEVGVPFTLGFTVVNTTELSAKNGWSFSDELPDGMMVEETTLPQTDCGDDTVVTWTDDRESVVVEGGSIARGQETCDVTIDVVMNGAGEYTNIVEGAVGLDGEPSATIKALVPHMTLTKVADPVPATADYPFIDYTFTVLNDGDVALNNVEVMDEGPVGGQGTMGDVECFNADGADYEDGDLAIGESLTCNAVYELKIPEDLTGKPLVNTAAALAMSPAGMFLNADATAEVATEVPAPELTLVKSADATVATKAGQVIKYSFAVTNSGNVNVWDITVTDPGPIGGKGTMTKPVCPTEPETLVPGATVTCTAQYTVAEGDLNGKPLENTATASGVSPLGPLESAPASLKITMKAPELAVTGGDVLPIAIGAFALVAAGATAVVVSRRNRLNG